MIGDAEAERLVFPNSFRTEADARAGGDFEFDGRGAGFDPEVVARYEVNAVFWF